MDSGRGPHGKQTEPPTSTPFTWKRGRANAAPPPVLSAKPGRWQASLPRRNCALAPHTPSAVRSCSTQTARMHTRIPADRQHGHITADSQMNGNAVARLLKIGKNVRRRSSFYFGSAT